MSTEVMNQEQEHQSSTKKKYKMPEYLKHMNENEKLENHKIIQKMNKKINYLRNPRFKIIRPIIQSTQVLSNEVIQIQFSDLKLQNARNTFAANPREVIFSDFQLNNVYEIKLNISNCLGYLQRVRFIPPKSQQFTISHINYPLEQGLIAPGMAVVFTINFVAQTLQELNDELIIISEENILKVPLRALKEVPVLNLPSELVCQGCWVGDRSDMVFRVQNKGGEAGFKFFCEKEEDDERQNGETIQMQNFTVYPSEFYIKKNQSKEIYVCFHPQYEGNLEQKIILACDNNTSSIFSLQGRANTIDLVQTKIDDINLQNSSNTLSQIIFQNCVLYQQQKRCLTILNTSSVKVFYHWVIFKQPNDNYFDLSVETLNFQISPSKGFFEPNSVIEFQITFQGDKTVPYMEYLYLMIDDIPFESIKNPSEVLKKSIEQNKVKLKNGTILEGPGMIGANTNRPSITYYEIELIALVDFCNVKLQPEFWIFNHPLYINKKYQKSFQLQNLSNCKVKYWLQLDNQTSQHIHYEINSDQIEGTIEKLSDISLDLNIWSDKIGGNQKLVFLVYFDQANTVSFEVVADFIGPKVLIQEPSIDMGLIRTDFVGTTTIVIENQCDIEAEVLIRNKEDKSKCNFEQLELNYEECHNKFNSLRPLVMNYIPYYMKLQPFEKREVQVKYPSIEPEKISRFTEVEVKNSDTKALESFVEVQNVFVNLNQYQFNFDVLFAGKQYLINKANLFENKNQQLILKNNGNLPTKFNWVNTKNNHYEVQFEPQSGVISPKSSIDIDIQLTPYSGGKFEHIFECDVEGIDYPLGFEIIAKVNGLEVDFLKVEADLVNKMKSSQQSFKTSSDKFQSIMSEKPQEVACLDMIEFPQCQINKPSEYSFIIKNKSGLNTKFKFEFQNYEPLNHKDTSYGKKSRSQNTTVRGNSRITGNQSNVDPNASQLSSLNTSQIPIAKIIEKQSRFYLSGGKGLAFVCEPQFGELQAYEEIEVKITLYNDICGKFDDYLIAKIEGLEDRKFPVKATITGSPIVMQPNQVGIAQKHDYYVCNIGELMKGIAPTKKTFRIQNTGSSNIDLQWKIYDLNEATNETQNIVDIYLDDPNKDTNDIASLVIEAVRPTVFDNDKLIKISPFNKIIEGKKSELFTIEFYSNEIKNYNFVLVAKPTLPQNPLQNLGEVLVVVNAKSIAPLLSLNKLANLDDEFTISLQKWAYGDSSKDEKSLCLINRTKTNLIFNIELDGKHQILNICKIIIYYTQKSSNILYVFLQKLIELNRYFFNNVNYEFFII